MDFLRWLSSIRTPFGDWLMSTLTHLGEETLFMIIALIIFWCVDKKRGYFLLFTGFTGIVCVQILKMIFRVPRPWVLDPNFKIVESARAEATGYSFPSGHTQCAVTLYGGLARSARRRTVQILGIAACVAVGLSRMYLGVHTPQDVLTSSAIGVLLIFLLYPIMKKAAEKPLVMYCAIGAVLLLALGNLLFVELYSFPADTDLLLLQDARENAWKLLFVVLAMCLMYPLDLHFIRFETKAVWWAQALKLTGGVLLILGTRYLLKEPLNALFGVSLGGGVRYFLMVVAAGILWPMTFPFFSRLGKKNSQ